MSETAQEFVKRLALLDQPQWDEAVAAILPAVHPVDQSAALIWFRFWPLRLCQALEQSADPQEAARQLELDGNWDLRRQIDSSISFFYGARFWPAVKRAVSELAQAGQTGDGQLAERFRQAARLAVADKKANESLTLGISAAALMTLRQVGWEAFAKAAGKPAEGPAEKRSPQKVLQSRQRKSKGLFDFLKGAARKHLVRWDERSPAAHFEVREGQDISWAAAGDSHDYSPLDPRRIEGPIPAQCRSAACGYCWIGILEGRQNIDPVSAFEQRRLHYFGYHSREADPEPHPVIRLACQSKCRGNVTLVVPPWNGVLDGQR